ncbi:MAG: FAD-binding oxidoreductase [Synergistaceae bacterium]|nr:FAD-binding oxidoreductase [Synergistaceae bacterium]
MDREGLAGVPRFGHITEEIIGELKRVVGDRYVLSNDDSRRAYARDKAPRIWDRAADAVVLPGSVDEVCAVIAVANRERIPVVPRGAGSGLSGGCVPILGGMTLSLERMNAILEYDGENRTITVEAGVLTNDINVYLEETPFYYAGFPMSIQDCMIGGNIATNAGGGKAVKYGVTGNHVLGVEIVTPEGEAVTLGGKNRKDVTGYDLKSLIIGSEGTLAVITKATLSLERKPAATRSALLFFGNNGLAAEAVVRIMSLGPHPASLELMDRRAFSACCLYTGKNLDLNDAECVVLVSYEEDSLEAAFGRLSGAVSAVADLTVATPVIARDSQQEEYIWTIRKALAEANHLYGSVEVTGEDIVVPFAYMPPFIERLGEIESRHEGIMITNCGHAADGNLHTTIHRMPGLRDDEWTRSIRLVKDEIYGEMRKIGGKLSGEHGIGSNRVDDFSRLADPVEMKLLMAIKKSIDPNGIMNPGTIFPLEQ